MEKASLLVFPSLAALALGLWLFNSVALGVFTEKGGLLLAFGRLAGILAALGVAGQLLVMSRAAWLGPLFGAFPPVILHHHAGLAIPLALLAHPVLIVWHYALTGGRGFLPQLLTTLGWEDVAAAALGAALIIAAVITSLPFFKLKLGFPAWRRLHFLTYVGLALSIGHQLELGGDLAGPKPYFAAVWYAMLGFTALNALWWRLVKPRLPAGA